MRTLTATLALVFTLAGSAATARADEGALGAACAPVNWANRALIWYTGGGAFNLSSSSNADLLCSTVRLSQSGPRNLYVDYFDGPALSGIGCSATATDFSGTMLSWSQSKYSGDNVTGGNFFLFTIPTSVVGFINVRCSIPTNVNGASGIIGFSLQ